MSATEAVGRMLTMVPWLLERQGATVDETATAFGVDRATVLSDLDTIGYCGLPGLGGGDLFEVSIMGDRILVRMAEELRQPLRLTPREALRLVLAGEAVAAALGGDLPALRSALDHVRAAVGVPAGVRVELEDDGTSWLPDLRVALDGARRVRIAYAARGDDVPSERVVDPWALHVTDGSWYLHGHDAGAAGERTFRLDRIAELAVLDESIVEAAPPGVETKVPQYEPGPDDIDVELLLAPEARWIAEEVTPSRLEDLEGGRLRVEFRTDSPRWVVRLALEGAPGVQVLRPALLATAVREDAEAALLRYA